MAAADLQRGEPGAGDREELSVVVGQLWRWLSMAVVRATSSCLLTRLTHMGEGSRQASKRQQWLDRGTEHEALKGSTMA